jgi:SAM-dependent methyltransferase
MHTPTYPQSVLEKLAGSLTANTTELLPFLPYLLQDLWELGSSPRMVADLIKKYDEHPANASERRHYLDLCCGKGAVSVELAKALGARLTGLDITPEFIDVARQKAADHGVASLCAFRVADANVAVREERGYDGVIFGSVGDILGSREETVTLLRETVREGGFIVIDDAYAEVDDAKIRFQDYITREQWLELFERCRVRVLEEVAGADLSAECAERNRADMKNIQTRAAELSILHPEKKALFDDYVASQADEVQDLESTLSGVVWMLRKL